MNVIARCTKVFAIPLLFFVNFVTVGAQGEFRLPAGTRITLSMDAEISSKVSSVNDTFTSTVSRPITVNNVVVLPTGTVIDGRVTRVSDAGFGGKSGRIQLRFETIRFSNGRKRSINGMLVDELRAESGRTVDLLTVFGGTAAGTIIGAASGKEHGTLIGAGIGAGAGTAVAFFRKGKDVYIRTDEEFEIELKSGVTLPANDY